MERSSTSTTMDRGSGADRPRRWRCVVLLLLAFGVVGTVGAAWAFAGVGNRNAYRHRPGDSDERELRRDDAVYVYREWGRRITYVWTDPLARRTGGHEWVSSGVPTYADEAWGWPMPALACRWPIGDREAGPPEDIVTGGWPAASWRPGPVRQGLRPPWLGREWVRDLGRRALPWRPLWGGVFVNLIFYSALGAIVVAGGTLLRTGRRRWRIAGGRCPACGYDRSRSAAERCSECGWEAGGVREPLLSARVAVIVLTLLVLLVGGWAVPLTLAAERWTPLQYAVWAGDAASVRRLLDGGADAHAGGGASLLMLAASSGDVETVEAVADAQAAGPHGAARRDLPFFRIMAGLEAAGAGHAEIALLLLDDLRAQSGFHPWYVRGLVESAARAPSPEVLEAIFDAAWYREHYEKPIARREILLPAIKAAASAGRLDNLRVLLDDLGAVHAGSMAHPSVPGAGDGFALWLAAETVRPEVMRELLAAGAHPDVRTSVGAAGEPVLHRAVRRSATALVRMLLDADADPFAEDRHGRSALGVIDWEYAPDELLDLLFGLGLDVNHRDADGTPLLVHAGRAHDVRAVERLLAEGADPGATDAKGRTAVEVARRVSPQPDDSAAIRRLEAVTEGPR